MITSVKNGNMTVTMTPSVRDLWNVATTTALLNSICLKPMIAVTCQLLRGNNAMKMQIVKKLSSAMGIRRPAEKIQSIHPALPTSVMITSVKNGNMTVTMTPSVRDLWNVATTTALLNSICLKPMIAVTCQICKKMKELLLNAGLDMTISLMPHQDRPKLISLSVTNFVSHYWFFEGFFLITWAAALLSCYYFFLLPFHQYAKLSSNVLSIVTFTQIMQHCLEEKEGLRI